jgi:hypothetical protein
METICWLPDREESSEIGCDTLIGEARVKVGHLARFVPHDAQLGSYAHRL